MGVLAPPLTSGIILFPIPPPPGETRRQHLLIGRAVARVKLARYESTQGACLLCCYHYMGLLLRVKLARYESTQGACLLHRYHCMGLLLLLSFYCTNQCCYSQTMEDGTIYFSVFRFLEEDHYLSLKE